MDDFTYRLPRPASGRPATTARVLAWLTARGYTVSDGVVILPDGSVALNADRDPRAEWDDYVDTETDEEAVERSRATLVRNALAALGAGTATSLQVQRIVAWLVRQEIARRGEDA